MCQAIMSDEVSVARGPVVVLNCLMCMWKELSSMWRPDLLSLDSNLLYYTLSFIADVTAFLLER